MIQPESRTENGKMILVEDPEIPARPYQLLRVHVHKKYTLQDASFPPTNTATTNRVYKPSPIDALTYLTAKLTYSVEQTVFNLIG
jgi:hypothetical protein